MSRSACARLPVGLDNLAEFKDADNLIIIHRDAATVSDESLKLTKQSVPKSMVLGGIYFYGIRFQQTEEGCLLSAIECVDPKGGVPAFLFRGCLKLYKVLRYLKAMD